MRRDERSTWDTCRNVRVLGSGREGKRRRRGSDDEAVLAPAKVPVPRPPEARFESKCRQGATSNGADASISVSVACRAYRSFAVRSIHRAVCGTSSQAQSTPSVTLHGIRGVQRKTSPCSVDVSLRLLSFRTSCETRRMRPWWVCLSVCILHRPQALSNVSRRRPTSSFVIPTGVDRILSSTWEGIDLPLSSISRKDIDGDIDADDPCSTDHVFRSSVEENRTKDPKLREDTSKERHHASSARARACAAPSEKQQQKKKREEARPRESGVAGQRGESRSTGASDESVRTVERSSANPGVDALDHFSYRHGRRSNLVEMDALHRSVESTLQPPVRTKAGVLVGGQELDAVAQPKSALDKRGRTVQSRSSQILQSRSRNLHSGIDHLLRMPRCLATRGKCRAPARRTYPCR